MWYNIKLIPNHIELYATLIGQTEDPGKFIEQWLAERPQFKGAFIDDTDMTWTGHNSYNNWTKLSPELRRSCKMQDGKPIETGEKYKYVMEESFDYSITARLIQERVLNIRLDGDSHYL